MENGFKGYHPVANIIYFVSIVVFGMLFRHPVTLTACFFAALFYYFRLCKKAAVKSFLFFLMPMLLGVLIINGLFSHYGTTPLTALPDGNQMTLEAIVYGFVLGVATVSVIMWFFCYSEVVSVDKFMCVFGKFLPTGALIISMILRFIPMYRRRLHIIAEAQRGVGKDYKQGNIFERIKNGGKIISILVTWSLENAIETADSMKARGYGAAHRKNYNKFIFRKSDAVSIIVMIIIDIVLAAGYINKSIYCVYNPYTVINPSADFGNTYYINELHLTINPVSVFGIITLSAFVILSFMPIIIDLKEEIIWKIKKSKM